MTQKTLYTTTNGIRTAYYDTGNKTDIPVIFIHGFPLDKSMWKDQMKSFSGNFRTLAYDIRGFGESEIGEENFSIELFAKDLEEFIKELSLDKVVLCGFSMGGYIALQAMQLYPEKICGLILADTQCQADTKEVKEKRMKSCENIRRGSTSLFADEILAALLHNNGDGEKSTQMIEMRSIIENTSKDALCGALVAMANREATCDVLSTINVPALILVGEDDPITPVEKSDILNSEISSATLKIIPYAKHLSNIDNPEIFNRHIKTILTLVQKQQSHMPHQQES